MSESSTGSEGRVLLEGSPQKYMLADPPLATITIVTTPRRAQPAGTPPTKFLYNFTLDMSTLGPSIKFQARELDAAFAAMTQIIEAWEESRIFDSGKVTTHSK